MTYSAPAVKGGRPAEQERMHYLDFLAGLHEVLAPPTYLEIGVAKGRSMALTRSPSIGIDPHLRLRVELPDQVTLFEETSDAYFQRPDALEHFGGQPISLAFIDGMHLAEYSLRDFINVERHSHWTSVAVFHDVLPRKIREAARDRTTKGWTGDVYKVAGILARYRPDLIQLRVAADPTGLLLILGLDPEDSTLRDAYDEIYREIVVPDPQDVPRHLLKRRGALEPESVLTAPFWSLLREARERDTPRAKGVSKLRRAVRRHVSAGRRSPLRSLVRRMR